MRRVLAIARLVFWEGVRMRIVLVFALILVFIVLRLPFALRGDETLSGRVQTFLSYSLSALSLFMSLAIVFLSCATLSKEIETKSLHLVLTKPVSRLQLLIGKWIGVNMLAAALVIPSGLVIYGFAVFISNQPAEFERDRIKIKDVVWTARESARPTPPDFRTKAQAFINRQVADGQVFIGGTDAALREYEKQLHQTWMSIRPGYENVYVFEGLRPPLREDTVYQVRFNARAIPLPRAEQLRLGWVIRNPETGAVLASMETAERSAERHQFLIRANNVIIDGRAVIGVANIPPYPGYRSIVTFEGQDGLEILYTSGTFEENFIKNLLLVLFRLAFLSGVGLFFGTFVSFPVACFCTLSIFLFGMGLPWWLEAIGADAVITESNDPYGAMGSLVRMVLVPLLTVALPNFIEFDGVTKLIDGQYITYGLLGRAALHTVGYGIVLLALPGWLIFRSREIAETIV